MPSDRGGSMRMCAISRGWAVFAACIVAMGAFLGGCSRSQSSELLVFAAISLSEALAEVETAFEEETGIAVAVSYGGSQTLAQQIVAGAPADVYIAAGQAPMDYLSDRGLLGEKRVNILGNRLVLVVSSEGGLTMESLETLTSPDVGRIAIADPDLAPAGHYAREALTNLDLWDEVQSKLIVGPDVRATLAYVETGNADVAFVYATDAMVSGGLTVLDIVPPESYPPIEYPAAVIRPAGAKKGAGDFLDFLRSAAARSIFRKHGFEPL